MATTKLSLRLPDDYPSASHPIIIAATCDSNDIRDDIKAVINDLPSGEEALDAILTAFQQLAAETSANTQKQATPVDINPEEAAQSMTIIVWLHHLLSTTKRKFILAPPGRRVSGIAKPGYPGVILLTGPAQTVQEHVRAIRSMNWQAFQVRAEMNEKWQLKHGDGVVEVETMAEIVEELGADQGRKELFLEAMKIK